MQRLLSKRERENRNSYLKKHRDGCLEPERERKRRSKGTERLAQSSWFINLISCTIASDRKKSGGEKSEGTEDRENQEEEGLPFGSMEGKPSLHFPAPLVTFASRVTGSGGKSAGGM